MIGCLLICSQQEGNPQKLCGDRDWSALYLEELKDRQAVDAVRSRLDIKYLLGLELTDPGFDFSVLSQFRARLIEHRAEQREETLLVEKLNEQGYLKKRGSQWMDSTHILAAVHRYHRVEQLPETLRAALNEVAEEAPKWLQQWVPADGFKRYERRIEEQTQLVHEELARRHLLAQTHLIDAGYVNAGLIVESRERYGVELLGPVSRNNQWQAKAEKGYDLSGFAIDFVAREATCPQRHKSIHWWETTDQHGHLKLYIRFDEKTCRECPCRPLCTRVQSKPRRLSIRSQEEFLQLQRTRK